MSLIRHYVTATALLAAVAAPAPAQVSGVPVRVDSGPLTDLSDSVSSGSRPVREPGTGSLRDLSEDSLSGGPVSDSVTGTIHSGSVHDGSAGSVHDQGRAPIYFALPEYANDEASVADTGPDLTGLQNSVAGVEPLPVPSDDTAADTNADNDDSEPGNADSHAAEPAANDAP